VHPPATSDSVRGLQIVPEGGWHPKDVAKAQVEGPALYFNGTMSTAAAVGARFLPSADSDYALFVQKLQQGQAMNRQLRDALLIHALDDVLLPTIDEERIDTIVSIRRSERVFGEWREALGGLVSGRYLPANLDLNEAQQLATEAVKDLVVAIQREISRSSTLAQRFKTSRMEAIGLKFAAAQLLVPGDLLAKAIGTMGAILKFALQSVSPALTGRATILLQLERGGVAGREQG